MANIRTAALAIFTACLLGTSSAFSAVIQTQKPCDPDDSGYCIFFQVTGGILTIRTIRFEAPRAGTALVTFHGSAHCVNTSSSVGTDYGVIDLTTQIVDKANATPDASGPGGLKQATRLPPLSSSDRSLTFNLASTRVFKIGAAGTKRFHFKIAKSRMDSGTSCTIFNAAFTVHFIP